MEYIEKIGTVIYAYCTDFIINLANISGLSYYEINALIFCFIYPFSILSLGVIYFIKKKRNSGLTD